MSLGQCSYILWPKRKVSFNNVQHPCMKSSLPRLKQRITLRQFRLVVAKPVLRSIHVLVKNNLQTHFAIHFDCNQTVIPEQAGRRRCPHHMYSIIPGWMTRSTMTCTQTRVLSHADSLTFHKLYPLPWHLSHMLMHIKNAVTTINLL